jgi:protein SCO1/2
VGYSLGKPDASGQYEVTHSSGVFVFDAQGKARLLIRSEDAVSGITSDLERLTAA